MRLLGTDLKLMSFTEPKGAKILPDHDSETHKGEGSIPAIW